MVDQIKAWLDLIPPEERKRWEWLDDPTTWGGMSRTIGTPVGQVYNPVAAVPDLLGALGTGVVDPIRANVTEPAMGAVIWGANRLPDARGPHKPFSTEAEVPLEGLDFGRYLRENTPEGGIGEFAIGMTTDPLSYVGGPLARGGRLVAQVPGLARAGGAVAAADDLYSATMGQAVGGVLKGLGWGARRIPGVAPWLEDSPQKAIALFSGGLRRAVDDPLAADRLEALADGSKLGLTGQAVDWEKTVRPGWVAIDTAIGESAHPLQQAALLQQRARALELENVLEARFEQHRIALEEGRVAGEISDREFGRETRQLWQLQTRATRAIQLGLIDSINAVKGMGDEALAAMAGEVDEAGEAVVPSLFDRFGRVGDDAVQAGTLTTALQRASDEALAAHDMGIAIKGGTSGVDKVEGLYSMSMGPEGERIAALQAQDPFYRQARTAAASELNTAAQAVFERYKDVADPADVAALDDAMRSAFQAAENELAPFTQTPEQALAGLGEDKRDAILKVWDTDSNVSLPKQLRRVLNARRALTDQVSPALHQWYREMGHSEADRTAAVDLALTSADRLLKEPALLAPEAAALRKEVIDRLNKFGHSGDILVAGDAPKVAANLTTSAYARSLGVTAPHPLLGAAATQLSAWKEQAVLSPAFQLANLIGGLMLGEAGGVSGTRVLNLLRHTLPQMKGVILEGKPIDLIVDGATSKMFSQIFGDAAGRIRFTEDLVGRSSGAGLEVTGLSSGPSATASGRIPLLLRAGVPALSTGGAYWAQNADDPDRARNALLVGGAAGAFGAATPHFVFYNQNLSAASEGAMRGAAMLTGAEEFVGSVSKGGAAKVFHDTKIEALVGKPTRVTSVGKEMTRSDLLPELNTVSGMQTLSPLLPEQKGLVDLAPLGATADEVAASRTAWGLDEPPPGSGPLLPPPEGPPVPLPPEPVIPHSDRIQPDVVSQALAALPEAIRADVRRLVGRIGVRDFGGDGGKFILGNPGRPGTVFIEPDQVENVRTLAHELLHAHVSDAALDADFLQRWAAARYHPAAVPAMQARIAENPSLHALGMDGNEDLTVALERYLFERDTLSPEQQAVLGEYLATLEPPRIEVAPPDTQAGRVIGLHRTGPSPVATAGGQTDVEAVKAAFRAVDGWMSADALEQVALRHGATAEEAARLRAAWDQDTTGGYQAGLKLANDIHFDYSDINKLTAGLRDTGIAPFITWQTKALPRFATLLLQNPRFLVAIDGLNNLSEQDVEEAGLTSRYARLVKMGVLGDVLAEQILGRAGGTVLGAPLKALFPYGDVGREGTVSDNANPLERALAELRPLGLSPGPVVTMPLMAAGAIGELPVDLNPTSRYLRPLSTQLTGREADPELLTRRVMAAARTATGAGSEPTVTGDFLRDRAIRQRIAEIAVEETGKPPAGPYLLAMDDPASQIWLRARAQVDRQRMGEAGLAATLPFRTKYLSDTEAEVRRIREQTGVGPTDSAARREQPATAAELAAAEVDTRKKPLKVGETLEQRAATKRWIAAENAAAAANPLAKTLNSLGGDDALSRQFPEYMALQRRIRHMSPKRRGQVLAEFLGPRKALREYLSNNNIYG